MSARERLIRLRQAFNRGLNAVLPVGGTTGQVLKKLSNANHDYGWQDDTDTGGESPTTDDGWFSTDDTWTRTGANTFTVAGDLTSVLTKGTKIKLTQTSVKYFYVTDVSHSNGTTTVTVTAGDDYTLAAAAITSPSYSQKASPAGFPHWFNFTVGFTGFSANPSGFLARFRITGTTCQVCLRGPNPGTSNSTSFTITGAPVTAKSVSNFSWMGAMWGQNGGATLMAFMVIDPGTTVFVGATATGGGTGWTNSGNKACHVCTLSYEY